jgi:hypothetical protein
LTSLFFTKLPAVPPVRANRSLVVLPSPPLAFRPKPGSVEAFFAEIVVTQRARVREVEVDQHVAGLRLRQRVSGDRVAVGAVGMGAAVADQGLDVGIGGAGSGKQEAGANDGNFFHGGWAL